MTSPGAPMFAVIRSGFDADPALRALNQRVCRLVESGALKSVVRWNGAEISIPNTYLLPAENGRFETGDRVQIDMGVASVRDVIWHFERSEPMYFLEMVGVKLSKRYFNEDLGLVHATGSMDGQQDLSETVR